MEVGTNFFIKKNKNKLRHSIQTKLPAFGDSTHLDSQIHPKAKIKPAAIGTKTEKKKKKKKKKERQRSSKP